MSDLYDMVVGIGLRTPVPSNEAGRRARVWASLLGCQAIESEETHRWRISAAGVIGAVAEIEHVGRPTLRAVIAQLPVDFGSLTTLPLRNNGIRITTAISALDTSMNNPELPIPLLDLANELSIDADEATLAVYQKLPYAGVDEGIEPVSDEHVALVCAAYSRELEREATRRQLNFVKLTELPFSYQRAFAERRRLRFQQYGIGYQQWRDNVWSVWRIPEDADWLPRQPRVPWG